KSKTRNKKLEYELHDRWIGIRGIWMPSEGEEIERKETEWSHVVVLLNGLFIQVMLFFVTQIDNLVKGASGQALQNLNLMMGFPEDTGLQYQPLFP
ncbi:hypothetical protein B296_00036308, partial [Ensete ventricosum]